VAIFFSAALPFSFFITTKRQQFKGSIDKKEKEKPLLEHCDISILWQIQ